MLIKLGDHMKAANINKIEELLNFERLMLLGPIACLSGRIVIM